MKAISHPVSAKVCESPGFVGTPGEPRLGLCIVYRPVLLTAQHSIGHSVTERHIVYK